MEEFGTLRNEILAPEAVALLKQDSTVVVLDVRTPGEFEGPSGHIAGSILIPVQELEERVSELEEFKDRTIVAVCRSGNRSGVATNYLNALGYKTLNLVGGMIQWNAMGLPVERGGEEPTGN